MANLDHKIIPGQLDFDSLTGRYFEIVQLEKGKMEGRWAYKLNENYEIIEFVTMDNMGSVQTRVTNDFDEDGNQVEMLIQVGDRPETHKRMEI